MMLSVGSISVYLLDVLIGAIGYCLISGLLTLRKLRWEEHLFELANKYGSAIEVGRIASKLGFVLNQDAVARKKNIARLISPIKWWGYLFLRDIVWSERLSFFLSLIACQTVKGSEERQLIVNDISDHLNLIPTERRNSILIHLGFDKRHQEIAEDIRVDFAKRYAPEAANLEKLKLLQMMTNL